MHQTGPVHLAAGDLVVEAKAVASAPWAHHGGYIEIGTHEEKPLYGRDMRCGGDPYFIFYHRTWECWFIGEFPISSKAKRGDKVTYSVQSRRGAASPDAAAWPEEDVQRLTTPVTTRWARLVFSVSALHELGKPLFKDPEFPHHMFSINRPGADAAALVDHEDPQWIPGRFLRTERFHLFEGIDPRDLLQGELGDCWLIAALAALAEFPKEVECLFKKNGLQYGDGDGEYVVSIFDHRTGQMTDIKIDEYIPCNVGDERWWDPLAPCFAKPNGNELWCLLLEKAMAKVFGSYSDLIGGVESVAWRAFTGIAEQWMWERGADDAYWYKGTLKPESWNEWGCWQKEADDDDFFTRMHEWYENSFLMCAGIFSEEVAPPARTDGLVVWHVYSLLRAVTVEQPGIPRLRLIQMRNPFADEAEWNGDWSDKSPLWNQHKEVKRKLRPTFADDGIFWMAWPDFIQTFTRVCVCPKAMRTGQAAECHRSELDDWRVFEPGPAEPPPQRSAFRSFRRRQHHASKDSLHTTFEVGQPVEVWSAREEAWVSSGGVVTRKLTAQDQLGHALPEGAVKVAYGAAGEKRLKWLHPEDLESRLRHTGATTSEGHGFAPPPRAEHLDPADTKIRYDALRGRTSCGSTPKGVHPESKELYLSDDEFQTVFGMDLPAFQRLPPWKQRQRKDDAGLF